MDHLARLSSQPALPRDHVRYLQSLKDQGFEPKVIYDIGSNLLHWTHEAEKIWPQAQIILFDAFQEAEFLYSKYSYHLDVLSDEDDKKVIFYQNNLQPGGNSYYREIGHPNSINIFPLSSGRERSTSRLETVVKERDFPLPDLIKIDVQGSELDVLRGAGSILDSCQHLIVELQKTQYNQGAPLVTESLPAIEAMGFKCQTPLFCDNGPDGDYHFVRAKN